METIRVSQSEVSTFTTCPKKYVYAHVDNLEPNRHSEPLAKGTLGHYFFELFLSGMPYQEAMEATAIKDPMLFTEIASQLSIWVTNFWPKIEGKFEVVATETTEFLSLGIVKTSDGTEYKVEFPFTIDAVFRSKKTGKVAIWDHKFVSQFYEDKYLANAKQMRLYAMAYGQLHPELKPTRAFYNMLSTKNKYKNSYSFKEIDISNEHMNQTLMDDQFAGAMQLAVIKAERLRKQIHAADIHTCKFCPFLNLCTEEMRGASNEELRNILKIGFRKNSYGY